MTSPRTSYPAHAARVLALVAAFALVLSGCGAATKKESKPSPSVSLPTQSVSAPAGVTLTKPGTELAFGQAATVGFAPTPARSTALEITVRQVVKGAITDLSGYDLDESAKASTPYYAQVTVRNVGSGDIGKSAVPLWGLAADDTLIGASSFTNAFARCPSQVLPTPFGANASTSTCLMFLVPQGGSLVGMSYRPVMANAPVVWKGTITVPTVKPSKKPGQAGKKGAHKKKAAS